MLLTCSQIHAAQNWGDLADDEMTDNDYKLILSDQTKTPDKMEIIANDVVKPIGDETSSNVISTKDTFGSTSKPKTEVSKEGNSTNTSDLDSKSIARDSSHESKVSKIKSEKQELPKDKATKDSRGKPRPSERKNLYSAGRHVGNKSPGDRGPSRCQKNRTQSFTARKNMPRSGNRNERGRRKNRKYVPIDYSSNAYSDKNFNASKSPNYPRGRKNNRRGQDKRYDEAWGSPGSSAGVLNKPANKLSKGEEKTVEIIDDVASIERKIQNLKLQKSEAERLMSEKIMEVSRPYDLILIKLAAKKVAHEQELTQLIRNCKALEKQRETYIKKIMFDQKSAQMELKALNKVAKSDAAGSKNNEKD